MSEAKVRLTMTFEVEVDSTKDLGMDGFTPYDPTEDEIQETLGEQFDEDPDMFINDYLTSNSLVLDQAKLVVKFLEWK